MMAEAIVRMAEQGFRIFPLVERAKKPYIAKWPERATTDLEQIRKWTEEDFPGCNIAVACGAGSSVFVLDIDGEQGLATESRWIEEHGSEWTTTRTAITQKGPHHYFQYPRDPDKPVIRNSENVASAIVSCGETF